MEVTLLGMVIEVSHEQPENAGYPIKRVPSFIVHDAIVLSTTSTRYVSAYRQLFITGRLVQPEKADSPIDVTLLGMVTEVRPEQPEKADHPMDVTLLGMVTEVKPEQPEKAEIPMEVTLLGMVMEVRPEQPEKANHTIDVTLLGIIVDLHPIISSLVDVLTIALQLLRESYTLFSFSTFIEVKLLHSWKI